MSHFDFREAIENVVIDVSHAHFWDITSVSAWIRWLLSSAERAPGLKYVG
jgi:SulP family sulfate permease